MNTSIKLVIGSIVIILALGIGLSLNQEQSDVKPSWVYEVQWSNRSEEATMIEELLWAEIPPYRTEYELVNINTSNEGRALRLRIIATAKDSDRPDIYDFVYSEDKLLLTGYLLEAIPPMYRSEAIGVALGDQEIASSVVENPTVRRILPKTSERFYAPKTLLSVTWDGISALVDPDEQKVVKVWRAGAQDAQIKGRTEVVRWD